MLDCLFCFGETKTDAILAGASLKTQCHLMSHCFGFPHSEHSNRIMSGDRLPHIWEVRSSIWAFFRESTLGNGFLVFVWNIHLSFNSWARQSVYWVELLVSKLRNYSSFLRDIVDELWGMVDEVPEWGCMSAVLQPFLPVCAIYSRTWTTCPSSGPKMTYEPIYMSLITRVQFDSDETPVPSLYFRPILIHGSLAEKKIPIKRSLLAEQGFLFWY